MAATRPIELRTPIAALAAMNDWGRSLKIAKVARTSKTAVTRAAKKA